MVVFFLTKMRNPQPSVERLFTHLDCSTAKKEEKHKLMHILMPRENNHLHLIDSSRQ